jgi:membrane protein
VPVVVISNFRSRILAVALLRHASTVHAVESGASTFAGVMPSVRRIRDGARALPPREAVSGVVEAFREHDLLVEAGAISFRILLALIPALLFVFGALGFLGLDEVWRSDIAPDLRSSVSGPAYTLINDAVINVLTSKQVFWVTIGLGLALWQISGVVRACHQILVRIYGADGDGDGLFNHLWSSIAVGAASGAAILVAGIAVRVGGPALESFLGSGFLAGILSFIVSWAIALGALFMSVGLIVRTAPDLDRPLHWISFGAAIVVLGWAAMTTLFSVYLTSFADYGSIFGNLATVFILVEYLYLVTIVFLGGLALDELVEDAG